MGGWLVMYDLPYGLFMTYTWCSLRVTHVFKLCSHNLSCRYMLLSRQSAYQPVCQPINQATVSMSLPISLRHRLGGQGVGGGFTVDGLQWCLVMSACVACGFHFFFYHFLSFSIFVSNRSKDKICIYIFLIIIFIIYLFLLSFRRTQK